MASESETILVPIQESMNEPKQIPAPRLVIGVVLKPPSLKFSKLEQLVEEIIRLRIPLCSERSVRTGYGVVTGKMTQALERRGIRLAKILDVIRSTSEDAYYTCRHAKDIPDFFFLLHDTRHSSMLHTELLEVIIEAFDLDSCREELKNYHETQLVPYVESCVDHTFVQTIDQNRSGNNKRAVAYNLGEEWNKLDKTKSRQAKKKIATLVGKDPEDVYIHGSESKSHNKKKLKKETLHEHSNNSNHEQPVQEEHYWQDEATTCHGLQEKHNS